MVLSSPPSQARRALSPIARAGLVAHGIVEILLGSLAVLAAVHFGGGRITDNHGAIETIGDGPFGNVLLIAVGVGLAGYALWQLARAIWDLDHGHDPDRGGARAIFRRIGYLLVAGGHVLLSITAFQLALGNGQASSEGDEARTLVARLVQHDLGQLLIGAVGVGVIVFGIAQVHKGITARFAKYLQQGWDRRDRKWAITFGRIGYVARGVVFGIVGLGLIQAARHASSSEVRDVGGALRELGSQPYGAILLVVVATGLVLHGVFMVLSAGLRRLQN
jgi:hypothetical protein